MVKKATFARSIILVDDDIRVLRSLRRALESAGHRVRAANSAEAALKLHIADEDVLVADRVMPRCGGLSLLKQMRERHPALKAVLISGHGLGPENKPQGVSFLDKPFKAEALEQVLDALL